MIYTTLDEAHPPEKRPQDTALGRAWVKALTNEKKQPKARKADRIKPNTKDAPVLLVQTEKSKIEVFDFYRRKS